MGAVDGHTGHGLTGVADAAAFLARVTRFDAQALVRLRPGDGRTTLWAFLPWGVLVSRTVAGVAPGDVTVPAGDLLAELSAGGSALPRRRDADWRQPLPPSGGRVVEVLPADELRRLAAAAASTLRAAVSGDGRGRKVGQRMLRDVLLDHVAVVVTDASDGGVTRVEVPQRLVQAVVRMGFLGPPREAGAEGGNGVNTGDVVHVRLVRQWLALSAPYGVAWLRRVDQLPILPFSPRTNG
jgi:hypothetical protein